MLSFSVFGKRAQNVFFSTPQFKLLDSVSCTSRRFHQAIYAGCSLCRAKNARFLWGAGHIQSFSTKRTTRASHLWGVVIIVAVKSRCWSAAALERVGASPVIYQEYLSEHDCAEDCEEDDYNEETQVGSVSGDWLANGTAHLSHL